jgi:long-subunit fatty acid transport protein
LSFLKKLIHRNVFKPAFACIVMAFFGVFCAMPATAHTQQEGPLTFRIAGGGVHQSEADLSDSSGGFALDRWFISAGIDYAWNLRNSIGFSVGGGRSTYEFNDTTGLGGGDPWNRIEDARVSVTWRFGFGETGSMIIIPTARFNGENGASSGDSSTYGLYAATAWRINESLTIGPGIGVFSRLEDGTRIFPILALDWDITDRWELATGRGLAASQGPGLTLGYKLNEDWTLGLAGRYEDIEFRLDDKGQAAGGVGRDQSVPLVFMATLEPSPKLRLSVFAGAEFNGTLKLKDAQGDVVDESGYDPAPIFGASFDFRF